VAAAAAEAFPLHLLLEGLSPLAPLRLALGQLATQAPQPMQVATSKALAAWSLPTSRLLASGALPVFTEQ
jgi:hypothetical protein